VILFFWKKLAPKPIKIVPAALLAVVIASVIIATVGLSVKKIEIKANLTESITWLNWQNFQTLLSDGEIWKMAIAVALIASAETLLCATAVDAMQSGPRTHYNRELFAQGVGNSLCGVMGSLPMTGVIVRSSANVEAGAKTRLSATLHGFWLLVLVVGLPSLLQVIPSACLAAILVYTGIKLVNFKEGRKLWKESRSEALIFISTLLGVVFLDLLKGVILGIALAAAKLLYNFSTLYIRRVDHAAEKRRDLHLDGAATFLRLPQLAAELDAVPPGWTVQLYVEDLAFIDHACLVLLSDWEKQHQATGGHIHLDRDILMAKFDTPPRATGGN
jgi:MFS superfamily sulfate permease-like transporter